MAGLRRRGVGFRSLHVALDTTTAGGRLVFHVFAAGAFTDPATGYTKLGLRYYNAGQGRFTQQDEVVQLATPTNGNRYAYASCDPVNRIDPTGQFPWCSFTYLLFSLTAGTALTFAPISWVPHW